MNGKTKVGDVNDVDMIGMIIMTSTSHVPNVSVDGLENKNCSNHNNTILRRDYWDELDYNYEPKEGNKIPQELLIINKEVEH